MTKTERIEQIVKKLKTRQSKNIIYLVIVSWVCLIFGLRFYAVSQENNFDVFNIERNNMKNGLLVDVLRIEKTEGVLLEPLTIKNNRGFVSGGRVKSFKSGQKIGECKIVSVSKNVDLDSGMHIVKTSGCSDGLQYVENMAVGFYVPASALHGNTLYVADNGFARVREIVIENRDSNNVLIKSGLDIGDIVILSNVQDNQKIKIAE